MKTFLIGLGVGIGLGILFAPDRGEETRRELGDRLNKFADEAKRQAGDVADQVRDEVRTKKEQIRETISSGRSGESSQVG